MFCFVTFSSAFLCRSLRAGSIPWCISRRRWSGLDRTQSPFCDSLNFKFLIQKKSFSRWWTLEFWDKKILTKKCFDWLKFSQSRERVREGWSCWTVQWRCEPPCIPKVASLPCNYPECILPRCTAALLPNGTALTWSREMLMTLRQHWTLCANQETLRHARQRPNHRIEESLE